MSKSIQKQLFYHKRPVFGLDVGSQSIKVMQLEHHQRKAKVIAYGSTKTSEKLVSDGVITNVPETAKLVDTLLAEKLQGRLTTNRVVMGVPVSHVFTRVLTLPQMSKKELRSAVEIEIEQSVPLPPKDLYHDFEATQLDDSKEQLVRMVAVPRKIIDAYAQLCELLRLDLALIQTNIDADSQLSILYDDIKRGTPYIIIDVGGDATDVGVLDSTLRVTGTVNVGGNTFTNSIAEALNIAQKDAQQLKVSKGLNASKQQEKVRNALTPHLDNIDEEIKRVQKFYNTRVAQGVDVSQIVITGGGANMPGLGDYITNKTRIPTRVSSPWSSRISFGKLDPPEHEDLPRFLTAAGLALAKESEATA